MREGRALLRAHLQAMLDMDTGAARKVSLNGPLVEQAQATLARMAVAERAYTLLKSEAHNDGVEDWIASQHGGPDMALVFEAANGANLDTIRVPGFFTYDGFSIALLGHMQTIADKLQKENWVLGPSGDQSAVKQQYVSLFPGILALYGKDFIASWTAAINNLQLKPLLNDKPKYLKLSAASAPTSPILMIFESIRDETALTRERPKPPAAQGAAAADQAKQDALAAAQNRLGVAGREAIDLAMKSQRRPGDPPAEVPGGSIEAYFKPYQNLVDGQPGSRPIDSLLANLNDSIDQLVLAASNPSAAKQALEQVDVQVASLRANVSRLPQPLAGMIDKVAKDAAGDATASTIAQIADGMAQDVTGPCQQIVANRYPFFSKSERDVPMADFAKLFAPGGVIEKFYSANLDPLVNRGRQDLGLEAESDVAKAFGNDLASVPAGRRDPRRVLSDRRQCPEHVDGGEAPDAEQRRADRDACRSTAQTSWPSRARPSPPRPCNGPAQAREGRPSRWRRTCPTVSRAWSARAHGRCFVSSTPAPRSRAEIRSRSASSCSAGRYPISSPRPRSSIP